MADEIVDIKIKFEAQTRELTKAIAQLSLLEKRVKNFLAVGAKLSLNSRAAN